MFFPPSLFSGFRKLKYQKKQLPGYTTEQLLQMQKEKKKGEGGEEKEKQKQVPVSDQSKTRVQAAILVIKRHLAHLQNQKTTSVSSTLLEG